jgi:hypothetical protein
MNAAAEDYKIQNGIASTMRDTTPLHACCCPRSNVYTGTKLAILDDISRADDIGAIRYTRGTPGKL